MPVLSGVPVGAELWATYESAFRDFAAKARIVQRYAADPLAARTDVETAILDMAKARAAYTNARDAVARRLLDQTPENVLATRLEPSPEHTAELAELFWKFEGRPEGTAEADWYRAEEILRSARKEWAHAAR